MNSNLIIKIEKYYKTNSYINEEIDSNFVLILKLYAESPDYYMTDIEDSIILDDWIHINIGSCDVRFYITYYKRDLTIEYPDVHDRGASAYMIKIITLSDEDREVISRKLNYLKLGQS